MTDLDLPYARLLNMRPATADECEDGTPMVIMESSDLLLGRPGYLHGGAIAGALEYACYLTLVDAIGDPATSARPVTVTVDYLRGGKLVETRACATILRLGKRIANVEGFAWQDDRTKPIASARMNFLLDATLVSAQLGHPAA